MDVGSGYIKAYWKPTFDDEAQHALTDDLLQGKVRIVTWGDDPYCAAIVAPRIILSDDTAPHLELLYSIEVNDMLEQGRLQESDVFR